MKHKYVVLKDWRKAAGDGSRYHEAEAIAVKQAIELVEANGGDYFVAKLMKHVSRNAVAVKDVK